MPNSRMTRYLATLTRVVTGSAPTVARDTAYQLQIYAIAWISLLASALFYVPVYLCWFEEPVGALAIALAAATGLTTMPLYLFTRSVRLALQAMSAAIFTVTSFLTWYQGGLSSPVAPWLLVVPFALSIAGVQGPATVWFVIVIAEMITLGVLELNGFGLPFHRGNDPQALFIVSQPGLCAVIFALLLLVNRARQLAFADLNTQNAELSSARDMAMAAVREKSRFLANMSHEIRTPLNGVLGTADVLASTPLNAEQQRFVAMLKQSGDSLLALINDVLDFSKIEAGKVTLESVKFDLRDLVENVAELFAPRAAEKGLICTCRVSPRAPSRIQGDPHRLRQVLTNLLSNAIKFSASGEVALEVVAEPAVGAAEALDITFRVIDTGIGIDTRARERLFQAFSQGDDTTTRVFGGTGLGLAISGELVRLMGSRIMVDSEPKKGSCFRFTLRHSPMTTGVESTGSPRGVRAPATVGLLETHPRSCTILTELLESMESRPVVFQSVSDLAGAILAGSCPPVCIVSARVVRDPAWNRLLERSASATPSKLPRIAVVSAFGESVAPLPGIDIAAVIPHPIRRTAVEEAMLGSAAIVIRRETASQRTDLTGTQVLLVEDNPVNQQISTAMLKRLGCEVDIATDGAMGIRSWRERSYDIVLMDCQMPVMDGYDATREIRAIEAARGLERTPVVALTANALAGDREQCLAAGMDDHLGKPFTLDLLHAAVARWIRKSDVGDLPIVR